MIQISTRMKRLLLGVGLALCAATASAGLSGHYIKAAHLYAPNGEIGSFEGLLGTELGGNLFEGWYSATITNDQISIVWTAGKTLQGLFGFNGFILTVVDGSPITSVSIAPSSTWSAFNDSRLTFDGSHVWADFGFLSSLPTQRLDLLVTTAVPEAPPGILMSIGLFLVTWRFSQGSRSSNWLAQRLSVDA